MIPHCSMTFASLRTIDSTIWRSSMVICTHQLLPEHSSPESSYQRLHIGRLFPAGDLAISQIDQAIEDLAAFANAHDVCDSVRARCMLGVLDPFQHDRLGRFPQRNSIEGNLAMLLPDDGYSILNLGLGERIERVRRTTNARNVARSLLQTIKSHWDIRGQASGLGRKDTDRTLTRLGGNGRIPSFKSFGPASRALHATRLKHSYAMARRPDLEDSLHEVHKRQPR